MSNTIKESLFFTRLIHIPKLHSLGRKKHPEDSVLLCMCVCLPTMASVLLTTTPIAVCLPCGFPEEPLWKRTAKRSPPERQAKDAQANSAQESLSSQAHSSLGGQNGLTPFPNNTQRICFQFVSLSFLDLKRTGPELILEGAETWGGTSPGGPWEEDLPLSLEGVPMAPLLPCTLIMPTSVSFHSPVLASPGNYTFLLYM